MGQRKENCSDAHRSARSETDIRFPNRFLSFIFSFQFLFPLSIILNTARKSSLAEYSNLADRAHVKEHSTRSLLSVHTCSASTDYHLRRLRLDE